MTVQDAVEDNREVAAVVDHAEEKAEVNGLFRNCKFSSFLIFRFCAVLAF
jgi:hypothetical protein